MRHSPCTGEVESERKDTVNKAILMNFRLTWSSVCMEIFKEANQNNFQMKNSCFLFALKKLKETQLINSQ